MPPDDMRPLLLIVLVALHAPIVGAQSDSSRVPGDTVLERARQLVNAGRDTDGRRVIDSVLRATPTGSPLYAEALYWRGALAATAADAERDYRRLLIEAPLAPRAEDAMLQLANLLQARGDRRGASDYLQRFMLTYASSPARPRVAIALVRLLFDQGPQQEARACEALKMGREAVPPQNLELRNQLDFYAPRCAAVVADATPVTDSTAPVPAPPPASDTAARPVPAATDTAPRSAPDSSRRSGGGRTAFYSVQVAAYDSAESAERLVKVLQDRGIDARVDGSARPFRVRIGRYSTRADAVKAAALLKAQGHNGFVTLVGSR
jgi:cell division septation protein DedD